MRSAAARPPTTAWPLPARCSNTAPTPGAADDSYGIEVAKLAGVPDAIITKAKTYLRELESGATELAAPAHAAQDAAQMTLGDAAGDEIAEQLRSIDLNTITPFEAMRLLFELQQKARG